MIKERLSLCTKCKAMTKSIVISRANWICEKCEANKTLSDLFYFEMLEGLENET